MQHDVGSAGALIDPELLSLVSEQRAVNEALRARTLNMPPAGSLDAARLRRLRLYNRDGSFRPSQVATAHDADLATRSGSVQVRAFPGADPRGLIVHFHGGGWSLGSIHEQDDQLTSLAALAGADVLSVDYPLAPENRLDHTLDVAVSVLEALLLRSPRTPIAIAAESAGAHVALSAVLRLGSVQRRRICALSLAYGIYDLSMTPSQRAWGSEFLGLSTDWLEWFYAQALPGLSRDERSDPAYSPLYCDLAGLPPTRLTVGDCDPLLDDTLFLYQRLRAADSPAVLRVFPEAPHGFNHQTSAMAARCEAEIAAHLGTHLSRSSSDQR